MAEPRSEGYVSMPRNCHSTIRKPEKGCISEIARIIVYLIDNLFLKG